MRLVGLHEDHGLIFSIHVGTPFNPENLVKRSFKPLLWRTGWPSNWQITVKRAEFISRHFVSS